jgi:hypothetical protein
LIWSPEQQVTQESAQQVVGISHSAGFTGQDRSTPGANPGSRRSTSPALPGTCWSA